MQKENKDTQENQSEGVKNNEIISVDEQKKLSLDAQKELINKLTFQDTDETESQEDETEVTDEVVEVNSKTNDKKETTEETVETPNEQSDKTDWEKRYKDLQRAFTKTTETVKALEAKMENRIVDAKETPTQRKKFDDLIEKNPQAKEFLSALKDSVQELLGDGVKPIAEKMTHAQDNVNEEGFKSQLKTFLASDLKGLQPEMDELLTEQFGSEEKVLEAARKNPNLFHAIKNELVSRHLDKVVELKSKKVQSPKERNEEVNAAGISGKSKTTGTVESNFDEVSEFKKLRNPEKMKAQLEKMGLVDKSAMYNKEWK